MNRATDGLVSEETLAAISAGGERVTHLYPNDCYFAHLSLYHFAVPFARDRRVLDAGSGAGYGSAYLAAHGARQVLGIDVAAEAVAFSQQSFRRDNLSFQLMDLQAINGLASRSFDLIFSSNTLEHLPSASAFLRAAVELLDPAGVMVVAVPPIGAVELRAENYLNPYHVNIWSPHQWAHTLGLYFEDVTCYRHSFARPGVQLNFSGAPESSVIDETDFTFDPTPLEGSGAASTLTAVFVARRPRPADALPPPGSPTTFVDDSFTAVEKAPFTLSLAAEVVRSAAAIRRLKSQLAERDLLQSQVHDLWAAVQVKNEHILRLEALLHGIQSGRMMRVLRLIERVRRRWG